MRLSASSPWTPSGEVDPAIAQTIVRNACETGADLVRRRRMSPAEAWDYEEAKGNNLIKLPAWCICQILGMEMARPIKVASAYIRMRNKDIRDEELIYEARVVTPDGARRELAPGKYQATSIPTMPISSLCAVRTAASSHCSPRAEGLHGRHARRGAGHGQGGRTPGAAAGVCPHYRSLHGGGYCPRP